jgi:hypothetical protein
MPPQLKKWIEAKKKQKARQVKSLIVEGEAAGCAESAVEETPRHLPSQPELPAAEE